MTNQTERNIAVTQAVWRRVKKPSRATLEALKRDIEKQRARALTRMLRDLLRQSAILS